MKPVFCLPATSKIWNAAEKHGYSKTQLVGFWDIMKEMWGEGNISQDDFCSARCALLPCTAGWASWRPALTPAWGKLLLWMCRLIGL